MKVRMKKHCRVDGKPAKPGDVVDTSHHRAKALTDTGYAEVHTAPAPAETATEVPKAAPIAPAENEAPASEEGKTE